MLADMMNRSMVTMNLRLVDHAALLVGDAKTCADVFMRDGERCHVCGSRAPGMMEIDHLKGHKKCKKEELATICQFCHNLQHPLWAAARKKIFPIYAPELSQADLNRLAWVALSWRDHEREDVPFDLSKLHAAIEHRRKEIERLLGCQSAASLFESAFILRDQVGEKAAAKTLMQVDQFLRYWPSEVVEDPSDLPASARLSTWSYGGFKIIADMAARSIRGSLSPNFEQISKAAFALEGA